MRSILLKILYLIFLVDLVLLIWRILTSPSSFKVLSSFSLFTPTPFSTLSPPEKVIQTSVGNLLVTPSPTVVQVSLSPTLLVSTPTIFKTKEPYETIEITQPKYSQEEIHGFIERFASQYSVDPNVLRHIAVCESGFNQFALNGPYAGLFQFGRSSWVNNRTLMGEETNLDLRFNAEESVQTAAFIISRGIKDIWPNCYP